MTQLHSKAYRGSFTLFYVLGNNPAGIALFILRYFAELELGLFKTPQLSVKRLILRALSLPAPIARRYPAGISQV